MRDEESNNYEILQSNREAAINFADSIKEVNHPKINIELKLAAATKSVENGDLTTAISQLNELKDNKLGIRWYKSENLGNETRALVRDARNATTDDGTLKIDASEKYAMQILNEIRGGIDLIGQSNLLPEQQLEVTGSLIFIAKTAMQNIRNLDSKSIKAYNTQIIGFLDKAGIEDSNLKLNIAKEYANFQDEHMHIVTLTRAQDTEGKFYTIIEADIMLNGLTLDQKNQYKLIAAPKSSQKIPGMEWYYAMPEYKKNLLKSVAGKIAEGNTVIPTQLISDLPGIKNGYQKVTGIKGKDVEKFQIISQTLHCGTPATKIKKISKEDKQSLVNENIKQLQSFIAPGSKLNLNTLNSKTPFNVRNEDFIFDQIGTAAKQMQQVVTSALPINKWRLLGGGKDNSVFRETLKNIGVDLEKSNNTKNVGAFLKEGSSLLGNLLEKFTFGIYQTIETKSKLEIKKLVNTKEAMSLKEAMMAKKLLSASQLTTPGNLNLKIVAAMNAVENSIKLPEGGLNKLLTSEMVKNIPERVDFCKSGKDRTGYVQMQNTHKIVSNFLGIDPNSQQGQSNKLKQVAGSHTQEMAGVQGGTVGCHSIKTNPEFGLSKEDKIIDGIINQQSSHFNSKIKVFTGKRKDSIVKEFNNSLETYKLELEANKNSSNQSMNTKKSPEVLRISYIPIPQAAQKKMNLIKKNLKHIITKGSNILPKNLLQKSSKDIPKKGGLYH